MSTRVVYTIAERYEAETAAAEARLRKLSGAWGGVDRNTRSAEKSLEGLEARLASVTGWLKRAAAAAAGFAIYRVGTAAIGGMVGGLKELEDATLGVATSLRLNDAVDSFDAGMRRATATIQRFRKETRNSPGNTKDFVAIYQSALPVMLQANRPDAKMEALTKRLVQFGSSLPGVPFEETGRSAAMTLSGAAGIDSVVWRLLGKKLEPGGVEKWNTLAKEDPGKAFDRLLEVLGPADEAAELAAKSFGGLLSSLEEVKDLALQRAGGPLFGAMKRDMAELLELADRNDRAFEKWSERLGRGLLGAYEAIKGPLVFLVENLGRLVELGKTLAVVWAASKMRGVGRGLAALGGVAGDGAAGPGAGPGGGDAFRLPGGKWWQRARYGRVDPNVPLERGYVELSGREAAAAEWNDAGGKLRKFGQKAARGLGTALEWAGNLAVAVEVGSFVVENAIGLGEAIGDALAGEPGADLTRKWLRSIFGIASGSADPKERKLFAGMLGATTDSERSFLEKKIAEDVAAYEEKLRRYQAKEKAVEEGKVDARLLGAEPELELSASIDRWKSALEKFRAAEEARATAEADRAAKDAEREAAAQKEAAKVEAWEAFFDSLPQLRADLGSLPDRMLYKWDRLLGDAAKQWKGGGLFGFLNWAVSGGKVEVKSTTTIHGGVRITVEESRNPERVAVLTRDSLLTLAAGVSRRTRSATALSASVVLR